MLTRDHDRLMRQKTRLLNQIEITLKEYYPRPLEVFSDLETNIARDFLKEYPTPQALSKLNRRRWNHFAKRDHHLSEARCNELWEKINQASADHSPITWLEPKRNFCWRWWFSLRPCCQRLKATARRSNIFSPLCRQLSL